MKNASQMFAMSFFWGFLLWVSLICLKNDNKSFWKKLKSLFGNKIKVKQKITPAKRSELGTNDKAQTTNLTNFSIYIVSNLGIASNDSRSNGERHSQKPDM